LHIFTEMKKSLVQKIKIPEGIEVNIEENIISVKGPEGENRKKFRLGNLKIMKENNELIISHEKATKKEKKQINTLTAHIKNMIKGVAKKFEYKLKICFSHFPISVDIKGSEVLIKNFLGEKIPRKTKILDGVDVKVNGQEITVISSNRESAGQTAANFETATKVGKRDRRIFQDGIFITSKAGREI
jgi:large subunit ribosomal protein L6